VTQYILSDDAERDLDGIWDYIAEDNIDAADQWIGRLFDAFEAIGNTPGIGHKREDLTTYPVPFWPVGAYLVIYWPSLCPSSSESQKFSTSQALLLYVEIVKARFLPSGEAKGTPRLELVVHNSETSPFSLTRMIVAACTDVLATNQPFPSADQLIPERCFATPKAIEREDPLLS
jgi:toxin ParE1/3/4